MCGTYGGAIGLVTEEPALLAVTVTELMEQQSILFVTDKLKSNRRSSIDI